MNLMANTLKMKAMQQCLILHAGCSKPLPVHHSKFVLTRSEQMNELTNKGGFVCPGLPLRETFDSIQYAKLLRSQECV